MSKRYCRNTFKILKKPLEKAIGAMFWKKGVFVFILGRESKISAAIHTFFCNPLYVYWLDSNFRVVDHRICKPNRIYVPKAPASFIIESTRKLDRDTLKDIIHRLQESYAS